MLCKCLSKFIDVLECKRTGKSPIHVTNRICDGLIRSCLFFFQYLESVFTLLFQLLQEVTQCDTKMHVLHVLSCVIERVNMQVFFYRFQCQLCTKNTEEDLVFWAYTKIVEKCHQLIDWLLLWQMHALFALLVSLFTFQFSFIFCVKCSCSVTTFFYLLCIFRVQTDFHCLLHFLQFYFC